MGMWGHGLLHTRKILGELANIVSAHLIPTISKFEWMLVAENMTTGL